MSKKITYLLGAGASANAIPVVADMHERIKEIHSYLQLILKTYTSGQFNISHPDFNQELYDCLGILDPIAKDLEWLIKEAGNYYTIDTLAKKYYLTDDHGNLARLKKTLITYFTLEQYTVVPNFSAEKVKHKFLKNELDKRYGNFIAAISRKHPNDLNNPDRLGIELNNEIKILSWNYDIQFELTLQVFLNKKVHFIQRSYQIYPNKTSLYTERENPIDINRFSLIKLNGNAIWDEFITQPLKNIPTVFDDKMDTWDKEKQLVAYLQKHGPSFNNPRNTDEPSKLFNFAWENDENFADKYPGHSKNLEMAELIAAETEILVVIGYSFPIFNREIDNRILNKMQKLEKVYVQDSKPDRIKSTMENAFSILQEQKMILKNPSPYGNDQLLWMTDFNPEYVNVPKIPIHLEPYTDQFTIPYELYQ